MEKTKMAYCLLVKNMILVVENGKQLLLYNTLEQLHLQWPIKIISIFLEDTQVQIQELE